MKRFQVKAGRFDIDRETKKVRPDKSKGNIILIRNEEDQTHFKWINLQTKIQEIDLIVFPTDASFQMVQGKSNTFILKFQMDPEVYYFWLQEKIDHTLVVQQINRIINMQVVQEQSHMQEQKPQKSQKVQKMQPQVVQKPLITTQKPLLNQDFISRLTKNISLAQKSQQASITHLQKIINYSTLNQILSNLSEQDRLQLLQYLPQQQQDLKSFSSNVRSAQFGQALDSLSDALNSETAISLFAEMGLNQKYLHQHYGVHAFLKALIQWGKQNKQ